MPSVPHRYLASIALALGLSGAISAQSLAPKESPFLPPPFQLTGVSTAADGTRVCIHTEKDQRSRWIIVGAKVDGIRVVSFDPVQKRAVIVADGTERDLELQRSVAASQTVDPGSNPAPAAPTGPSAPAVKADETASQRDARMLVSDLLDIGAQQRQAYANAQKAPQTPADGSK